MFLRNRIIKSVIAVSILVSSVWLAGCSSSSNAGSPTSDLETANGDFASKFSALVTTIKTVTGVDVTATQKPKTIVITCSDSRVPPELIFNKSLGDLFVVRVAGNIADTDELASVDYAVEHLGANRIIVLGHTKCGAVGAATTSFKNNNMSSTLPAAITNLDKLVNKIYPNVAKAYTLTNYTSQTRLSAKAVEVNAEAVFEQLKEDEVVKTAMTSGLFLGYAIYDIANGTVSFK